MTCEEVVLKYWNAWQVPADFEAMEGCLAPDVRLDMGAFQATSAAEFRAIVESNPTPWAEVTLLDSHFGADSGTIVYEGTNTGTGVRTRVAELCRVSEGRITHITAVLGQLPPS